MQEESGHRGFPTTTHSYTQLTLKPSQQKGSCHQNTPMQRVGAIHKYTTAVGHLRKTTLRKPETGDS